jgi:hypothetical protein
MDEQEPESEAHDRGAPDHPLSTALRDPPLRAALLALGVGIVWAALAVGRRRRPTDVW